MRNIEDSISVLVKSQFPSFYTDEGSNFVEFVKEYYKYLEETNNPLYHSRNLIENRDIDKTIDSFIIHFKEKYLKYFPYELAVEDTRFLIKHVMDFYRSKGSERSYEIFFRSVYGSTPSFYYPKDDIFRLSDGTWYKPVYLEVKQNGVDVRTLVQKTVVGSSSGATAFCESIITKRANGKFISVVYLSNLSGNFVSGEILTLQSNPIINGYPLILGSLSSVDIITGGENFVAGDILKIVDGSGQNGYLRVVSVATETGIVKFELVESGFGYTNTANVLVSNKVLDLTGNSTLFQIFDTVRQPKCIITFTTGNAEFQVGDVISGYYANNNLAGNGSIIAIEYIEGSTSDGTITVSAHSGNVANGQSGFFYNSGNTAQALIDTYTDTTASANMIGQNTMSIGVINVNSTFVTYENNVLYGQDLELTGEVSIEFGNTEIVGTNSFFLNEVSNGDILTINSFKYAVDEVVSNTSITLTTPIATDDDATANILKSRSVSSVLDIGLGYGASFKIGYIGNPENVRLDYTFLKDRNTSNVPYLSIGLDGTNSGLGSGQYGFIKYPGGDIDTILIKCFEIDDFVIGSVESLVSKDGGDGYTKAPFVKIYDPKTAGYDKRDWILTIENTTQNYQVGEIVEQSSQDPAIVLVVSSLGGNTTALEVGEFVYQSNGTANVASGYIHLASIDENGDGSITLVETEGTFTTSYDVATLASGANASVDTVDVDTIDITGRGIVKEGSDTTTLYLKRLTFFDTVRAGSTIVGLDSGAAADVIRVKTDETSLNIGNNCLVSANVIVANGTVVSAEVYSSGKGYVEDEIVSAEKVNEEGTLFSDYAITVKTHAEKQGYGFGFYKTKNGFASDDKYLHDGNYYQQYSYDIRSTVPFELYKDILKQIIHVAGTKVFGTFVNESIGDVTISSLTDINTSNT